MATYITFTKGIYGGVITEKQQLIADQARRLDVETMSLYYYPVNSDTSQELSKRLDGIMSAFSYDDNLMIQLPTLLGNDYTNALIDKVDVFRNSSSSKLIEIITDLPRLQNDDASKAIVKIYNRADLLILPSVHAAEYLRKHGVTVTNQIYLPFFECQFPLNLPIPQYVNDQVSVIDNQIDLGTQVVVKQFKTESDRDQLPFLIHQEGGFGLVWPQNDDNRLMPSTQVGTFISAGVPIILQSDDAAARFIANHNLGKSFNDLETMTDWLTNVTETEYHEMAANVAYVAQLARNGGLTRQKLNDALFKLTQRR